MSDDLTEDDAIEAVRSQGNGVVANYNQQVLDVLDAVIALAVRGEVQSVALAMVDGEGHYRLTAAGIHVEGMLAGARDMVTQLEALMPKPKPVIIT